MSKLIEELWKFTGPMGPLGNFEVRENWWNSLTFEQMEAIGEWLKNPITPPEYANYPESWADEVQIDTVDWIGSLIKNKGKVEFLKILENLFEDDRTRRLGIQGLENSFSHKAFEILAKKVDEKNPEIAEMIVDSLIWLSDLADVSPPLRQMRERWPEGSRVRTIIDEFLQKQEKKQSSED